MRYIQRDKDGKLIGHFACEQPYATEIVADDHPDIMEWNALRASERSKPSRLELRLAALEAEIAELRAKGK